MLDVRDAAFLRAACRADDTSLAYRRVAGNSRAATFCFLPWLMPARLATGLGILPKDFIVCFEMPPAIVSSEPELCVKAMRKVVTDARDCFTRSGVRRDELLVVGWSLGTAPATYFANAIGARLCSIASADRGDLMLWESSATRHVRDRAIEKGYTLEDFAAVSHGCHPAENLQKLARGSQFVLGRRDDYVPPERRRALAAGVAACTPGARVSYFDTGHVRTMLDSVPIVSSMQREMATGWEMAAVADA